MPVGSVAGVESFESLESIQLYPNPTNNMVNLSVDKPITPSSIVVRNLAGQIVLEDYSGATSFSCEDFEKGVYVVSIEFSGTIQTVRLVKN